MNSLQSAYAAAEPNAEPARARQEPPPVLLDDLHRAGGPRGLMSSLRSAYQAAEPNAGIVQDGRRPLACRGSKQSHPLEPDP